MRRVVLYGNSLVVSSIGAGLRGRADLQVLSADASLSDAVRQLDLLEPDVIIFDLIATQPEFAVALWKAHPHLVLIGVNLATEQALVLSGQASQVLTIDDLVRVIECRSAEPEQHHT